MALRRRSSFLYPGSNPGFDPSHPAAKNAIFSGVIGGGMNNYVNLLGGKIGTIVTVPVGGRVVKPVLGPALGFDNSSIQRLTWTGFPNPPASPYPTTLAGIFTLTALHNNVQCLVENASGAQIQLGIFSNTFQLNRWGGSNDNTGFTPVAGVPYFLACSTDNANQTTIVWTRLDTGLIGLFTATPAGATTTGTITVGVGSAGGGGNAFDGFISEFMYSQCFLPRGAMLAWAADPRSYWYPLNNQNLDVLGLFDSATAPPPPLLMPGQQILWM